MKSIVFEDDFKGDKLLQKKNILPVPVKMLVLVLHPVLEYYGILKMQTNVLLLSYWYK